MENNSPINFLNTGLLIQALDYRTIPYDATAPTPTVSPEALPAVYRTMEINLFKVLMQDQTPACVSNYMARAMQLYWYKKTGKIVNFSRRFIHTVTGVMEKSGPNDGRFVTDALKLGQNIGYATTSTFPDDTKNPDGTLISNADYMDPTKVSQAAYTEAQQYKIPGYASVAINQALMRHAIYHYGSIGLSFAVGQEWWTAPDGRVSWAPADLEPNGSLRPPAVVVSGHQVTGEGWNNSTEEGENSWSDEWDKAGFFDYNLANYKPIQIFTIYDPAVDWHPIIHQLPPANTFTHHFDPKVFLKEGMTGPEVTALQTALLIDGSMKLDPSIPLGYFGDITRAAVNTFQLKYASDILVPAHASAPTGVAATYTLNKLNALFNK